MYCCSANPRLELELRESSRTKIYLHTFQSGETRKFYVTRKDASYLNGRETVVWLLLYGHPI